MNIFFIYSSLLNWTQDPVMVMSNAKLYISGPAINKECKGKIDCWRKPKLNHVTSNYLYMNSYITVYFNTFIIGEKIFLRRGNGEIPFCSKDKKYGQVFNSWCSLFIRETNYQLKHHPRWQKIIITVIRLNLKQSIMLHFS